MAGSTADIVRWNGGSNNAWTTAANFESIAGTPSTPPAAGEALIVDGRSVRALETGPAAAVQLGLLDVRNGCPISFGTESAPLDNVDADEFRYSGVGKRASFNMTATEASIYKSAALVNFGPSSVITRLYSKNAEVKVADSGRVDTAYVYGPVTFGTMASNHLQYLYCGAGARVTLYRNVEIELVVGAGSIVTILDGDGVTDGAAAGTDAARVIMAGGELRPWGTDIVLNEILGISGKIDPTQANNDVIFRTMTRVGDRSTFEIIDDADAASLVIDSGYGGATDTKTGGIDPLSRTTAVV